MNCKMCQLNNSAEIEQLVDDLVDYLKSVGVSVESMVTTQIRMCKREKFLTDPPLPTNNIIAECCEQNSDCTFCHWFEKCPFDDDYPSEWRK